MQAYSSIVIPNLGLHFLSLFVWQLYTGVSGTGGQLSNDTCFPSLKHWNHNLGDGVNKQSNIYEESWTSFIFEQNFSSSDAIFYNVKNIYEDIVAYVEYATFMARMEYLWSDGWRLSRT